ncbi:MAG: DUF4351 domain-containing protein, partial [Rhizonema sp. NSF051]|nr:DUF4351 domain-containing protein [Rhizonema sp. NSF051]
MLDMPVVQEIMRWDMTILRESPWYQQILTESEERSFQQSFHQGFHQGFQQGTRRQLIRVLQQRFGEIPAFLEVRLESESVEKLESLMDAAIAVTSLEEFLTQKLCQFMVEESESENPRSVEQVVKSRIIENWESLDEPEHLRTIRARILRDEQRAGYLLELYQQLRLAEEHSTLEADDTLEQSELQLSGLVIRQHNKLRVYNLIYQEIFDDNWIENQLKNLRPYSESFRFWVASEKKDKSRLLRGLALRSALLWADEKNLNYQDREFLSASQTQEREEEVAVLEKEAQLERESQDREAAQQRNQVLADANQTLTQANKKAKQQIRVGSFVLSFTVILGILSVFLGQKIAERSNYLNTVQQLAQLAAQLQGEGSYSEATELFSQAGQSVNIDDQSLKMDLLYTGISYAEQKLKSKKLDEADQYLKKVKVNQEDNSPEELQIHILKLKTQGNLWREKKEQKKAMKEYDKAFDIWDKNN